MAYLADDSTVHSRRGAKALGLRIKLIDNINLFQSRDSIKNFMAFLENCGISFLNVGSIFARNKGEQISQFAIDPKVLTPAVLNKSFSIEQTEQEVLKYFAQNNTSAARVEFSNFCQENAFWLDDYAIYRALIDHTEIEDFSKWPDILRICHRKTADILRRQLSEEILRHKAIQYFAHQQLQLIKNFAKAANISVCVDCDVLCDRTSAEIWREQRAFFVDALSKPTVFVGFPESITYKSGLKTTKVPYRTGFLKTSKYELFVQMFSHCEKLFDSIFLVNGHTIFQYWEVSHNEHDPRHGRWVNMPTSHFFSYLNSHFDKFPYMMDFNEPLFPENEIVLKRHNILPVVIDGEPDFHECDIYDLGRDIYGICSVNCNKKIANVSSGSQNTAVTKALIKKFYKSSYKLCMLDFSEIADLAQYTSGPFSTAHSDNFLASVGRAGKSGQTFRVNKDKSPRPTGNKPKKSKIFEFFSKFFR